MTFVKISNFCGISLSLSIILYIFINHFHYGDLKEVSCNHTVERFKCSSSRPSNCSFHNTALQVSRTLPWMPVCVQSTRKKSLYCVFAGCESRKKKFGIIERLFKQPSASKEFPWTALNVFKEEQFDFTFGLWWEENLTEKKDCCCCTWTLQ